MTRRGTITTGDGCQLAWRSDGAQDAPVLLLSNSLGTSHAMWDAQIAAWTARFRVLRYDSRGHGQSGVTPRDYGLDRLGRDVIELLDELGIDRVDFCGLSLGGMVGQWLAARAPERLRRAILANTAPYMGPPAMWDQRIATVLRSGMATLADASVARWFTPDFARSNPDAVDAIRAELLSTDPRGYAGCCAAIRDMDLRPLASLNGVETLVIAGTEDRATPFAVGSALAHALPRGRLLPLPAAHLSNVEQPAAFAAAVLSFLG